MTAKEFVDSLWSVYDEHQQIDITRCKMDDKLTRCEIEDKLKYVLSNIPSNEELTRNQAAKILHAFIRDVLGIPDITYDKVLQKAAELKDLYDCRTCVADIMQVYVRGVMEAGYVIEEKGMKMFGGGESLSMNEQKKIKKRLAELI